MFDKLKNLGQLAGMMGQAKEMQQKMEQLQEELAHKTVTGQSGYGAVKVTISGKLEVTEIKIDPAMLGAFSAGGGEYERKYVESLILLATNDALNQAKILVRDEMAKITGGLNIPGMDSLPGL
jgi:DNA-binding YbaB/EbfC family protein